MRRLNRTKKNMLKRQASKRRRMVPAIAFILLLSLVMQTFAFTPNTPKEEVIYVNLNPDGSVDAIYVVNSFDLSKDGKIIDYGDYTAFRQLTESSDIQMENETISIDAAAGKVYYEGKMRNESIPWKFSIKYFINGKEYTGKEVAGKGGNLKINIEVGENPAYLGKSNQDQENAFFKNLTLQLGLTFDSSKTKNIEAEGAVIANAGKNKQIAFTVLPGRESSFTVSAQVTDFEMDGITINGIPLSMDFDIEDDPEMTKEMKKLKDGVKELDDGARELRDGVKDLREGTEELKDGVEELKDGVIELADGTKELRENTDEFVDGVKELDDGVKDLRKGTRKFRNGILELVDGLEGLTSSVGAMSIGVSDLSKGLNQMSTSGPALVFGAGSLFDIFLNMASENISGPALKRSNYDYILKSALSVYEDAALQEVSVDLENITTEATYNVLNELMTENPDMDPTEVQGLLITPDVQARIEAEVEKIIRARVGALLSTNGEYVALYTLHEQLKGFHSFYDGIVQYTEGVTTMAGVVSVLSSGINELHKGLSEMELKDLRDGVLDLYDGVIELKDGTAKLLDGAIELKDGIIELDDGVIEFKDGILELFDGAIELHDGVIELHDGTIEMAKGTMEFKDKTADLEETLTDKIKEKIDEMLGAAFKVQSFVSEKNTNIDSVQFVMKTADIVIAAVEEAPAEPAKPLSFFDRLLALFTFLIP